MTVVAPKLTVVIFSLAELYGIAKEFLVLSAFLTIKLRIMLLLKS